MTNKRVWRIQNKYRFRLFMVIGLSCCGIVLSLIYIVASVESMAVASAANDRMSIAELKSQIAAGRALGGAISLRLSEVRDSLQAQGDEAEVVRFIRGVAAATGVQITSFSRAAPLTTGARPSVGIRLTLRGEFAELGTMLLRLEKTLSTLRVEALSLQSDPRLPGQLNASVTVALTSTGGGA